jgi:cell division topological specificity factor MinE
MDTVGFSTASANSSQGDKHMAWGTFVQRLLGNKGSAGLAKDRLQVVVMYDRLGLSAEQLEALRKDIMETISRHVAIDSERVKIDFMPTPAEVKIIAPVRRSRARGEEPKQHVG